MGPHPRHEAHVHGTAPAPRGARAWDRTRADGAHTHGAPASCRRCAGFQPARRDRYARGMLLLLLRGGRSIASRTPVGAASTRGSQATSTVSGTHAKP